jgi:hypothetical protein
MGRPAVLGIADANMTTSLAEPARSQLIPPD